MTDAPYNIVLILTDQHRADHLSCYGNPVLSTPHLDSLAARGLRCTRCYVANPSCMPNRATLLTGCLPSLHGVRYNGIPLHAQTETFVQTLRQAGYHTALIGKSDAHLLRPPTEQDQGEVECSQPYYGFDEVYVSTGYGDTVWGHYWQWLTARHPQPHTLRGAANALPLDRAVPLPQAWRTRVPEELYPTTYITAQTVQYLERHTALERPAPFFLYCSFPDPHHPFTPPGRYFDRYVPEDIPLPAAWGNTHRHTPPHMQALLQARGTLAAARHTFGAFAVSAEEARQAIALTYGMLAMVDDGVGQILATLDRLGLAKRTMVLFTSDHGDLMGDHQFLLKGPYHFQGLIRVPLLLTIPGKTTGAVTDALVCTMDLAATLLHLAGLEPSARMQGRSLVPLLADPGATVRDHVLIEDDGPRPLLPGAPHPMRLRTLVTSQWRLTYYDGFPFGELYDLQDDALEHRNLWEVPAAQGARAAVSEQLLRSLIAHHARSPWSDTGPA
jgi:arylsulfatase A-like enzyme